jgi:hypothetical protein
MTPERASRPILAIVMVLGIVPGLRPAFAQELEPRTYANTPIGMNFLLAGVGYSQGALLFDPSVPIQDADAKMDIGLLGYVRSFAIADKSAKAGVLLPYGWMDANGTVDGVYAERKVSGLADPSFLLSVNFVGAPALTLDEYRRYRQDTIIGATLKVTAPLGQYDDDRLLNLGTHRWSFEPEIGISKALGNWVLEGAAAVSFYTPNDDFFGGQTLKQDPIYSLQGHVLYDFPGGLWVALDATYYTGGITTVNGVKKDNELDNWRTGLTIAVPINRQNSIKLAASTGVSTRTGTDFDLYMLAWQYRWGGGL